MRDRFIDLLPLVLVSVVLLVFYLLRAEGPGLSIQSPSESAVATAVPRPSVVTRQRAGGPQATCSPNRPVFVGNLAQLKSALGTQMGDPLECERVVDTFGNTQQETTSGLAYVRIASNLACFTTGWDHWALMDRHIVFWQGDAVEPPS